MTPNKEPLGIGDRVWVQNIRWWGCDDESCPCAVADYLKGTIAAQRPCSSHPNGGHPDDRFRVQLDRHHWYHFLWPWRPVKELKARDLVKLTLLERLADV
jgi:hypothetical protein